MAIDPVSAGLGAVSLISGKGAQKKAQKTADKAQKSAQELEKRGLQLFDVLFSNAQKADQAGQFDPEQRIANLERDTARYESRDLGNLAGALTTAGYRPGDSEIGTRLDSVKMKYRQFAQQMADDIRQKAFMEKQQAYASASPQYLGAAISGARQDQSMAQSQANSFNPAGFLSSFMQNLNQQKTQPTFYTPKIMRPGTFTR